jgi:hypothetical protein
MNQHGRCLQRMNQTRRASGYFNGAVRATCALIAPLRLCDVGPSEASVTRYLYPDSSCQSQLSVELVLSFVSGLTKGTLLRRVSSAQRSTTSTAWRGRMAPACSPREVVQKPPGGFRRTHSPAALVRGEPAQRNAPPRGLHRASVWPRSLPHPLRQTARLHGPKC